VLGELQKELIVKPRGGRDDAAGGDAAEPLGRQLAWLERQIIFRTLEASGFDRREAARRLGISVRTFWRKLDLEGGEGRPRRRR
jgi:DNA-binding NtrC family response regulator